jgi:hypothetical protein
MRGLTPKAIESAFELAVLRKPDVRLRQGCYLTRPAPRNSGLLVRWKPKQGYARAGRSPDRWSPVNWCDFCA